MLRLLLFLHHFALAYLIHCTMLLYTLDHAESELEEPMEQAQGVDPANLALDQGKPRCI
jgi:hypothetical protein